ncbi:MAG: hypothetical protein EBS90_12375 [Betaproteobacteria bacterium]|nr:hypothetical protein [Betaproteobacteria bacterium]
MTNGHERLAQEFRWRTHTTISSPGGPASLPTLITAVAYEIGEHRGNELVHVHVEANFLACTS